MRGRKKKKEEKKYPIFKRAKDHESAAEKKDQIDLEMSKFNDGEIFTHFDV